MDSWMQAIVKRLFERGYFASLGLGVGGGTLLYMYLAAALGMVNPIVPASMGACAFSLLAVATHRLFRNSARYRALKATQLQREALELSRGGIVDWRDVLRREVDALREEEGGPGDREAARRHVARMYIIGNHSAPV